MIVELSGGHKAELRDKLKAKDYRIVTEAITLRQSEDGWREISMAVENVSKRALVTSMVTWWDYPALPLPKDAVDPGQVIDELDGEDWEALAEAVDPFYRKIMGIKVPKATTDQPSRTITGTISSDDPQALPATDA